MIDLNHCPFPADFFILNTFIPRTLAIWFETLTTYSKNKTNKIVATPVK